MADLKSIGDDSREITYEEFVAAQKSARNLESTQPFDRANSDAIGPTLDASITPG